MAGISLSSLSSSFSALSFSSQISSKPKSLNFSLKQSNPNTLNLKTSSIVASAAGVAAPVELETTNLEKYVKSRVPGGFAAQKLAGTGRRKCAIARVVLQEGTGKFIINNRDANVSSSLRCRWDLDNAPWSIMIKARKTNLSKMARDW